MKIITHVPGQWMRIADDLSWLWLAPEASFDCSALLNQHASDITLVMDTQ
jgi:hypothetical protein